MSLANAMLERSAVNPLSAHIGGITPSVAKKNRTPHAQNAKQSSLKSPDGL
jgi:hypothetical protein